MSVSVARTLVAAPAGAVPATVAKRLPSVAGPLTADRTTMTRAPGGTLPAVDVALPATATAEPKESGSLLSGLIDGAKDNLKSLVTTVKDKPFLSGAVVLGYHALILTPLAGVVTGGLAALGVIGLAKKGIAAVEAHNDGDLYGAGKALGSGLTDLGLTSAPKVLGRLSGGVKAADTASESLRGFEHFDDFGRVSQAASSQSTLSSVTKTVLSSAKIARRGVGWAESAQGALNGQAGEPPAQPTV